MVYPTLLGQSGVCMFWPPRAHGLSDHTISHAMTGFLRPGAMRSKENINSIVSGRGQVTLTGSEY